MKLLGWLALLTIAGLATNIQAQKTYNQRKAKIMKARAAEQVAPAEIARVAAMLTEKPTVFGRPVGDRAAWDALARGENGKSTIREAARRLRAPMPRVTDDLYQIYSRTGSRSQCDRVFSQQRDRLTLLAEAELLENKGRFLPALEDAIRVLCAQATWVGTAHDSKLTNFHKTGVTIDLFSSAMAWNLVTIDNLLGDKLGPEIRQTIRKEVKWRIFDPFHRMIEGKQSLYWLPDHHNWNSVCLAGVTGAALGLIESRQERAFFVAAAEKYSQNFLLGFTKDGYCGEGMGYWNYGYGHYILLAEAIRLATQNKLDLMAHPAALAPASFGARFEVMNGVYPAFADTSIGSRPAGDIMEFVNQRFGFGLPLADAESAAPGKARFGGSLIFNDLLVTFPVMPAVREKGFGKALEAGGPRSWFDDARILICRPPRGSSCRLAAAIIGNDNGVNHNHNDVGSYIVVLGNQIPIADPGGEVYTARTFSAHRYDSNVLNSFGHCVPLVTGRMQDKGPQAKAVTVRTDFSDARDTLVFDIRSAYGSVADLQKLLRTYIFSRDGAGSLTVTDEVVFAKPESFETALITFGQWKQTAPGKLRIEEGGQAVNVEIQATGADFEVVPREIHEQLHAKRVPIRLGIRLKQPVARATVSVKITPAG